MNETKGGKNAWTPQINQSIGQVNDQAAQTANYGNTGYNFANNYYNTNVKPALANATQQAGTSQDNLNNVASTNGAIQTAQAGLANGKGLAAQNALYDQAANYNTNEEFDRQAQLAKGDVGQAEANQDVATTQRANAYGTDPNSGQSMALSAQNRVSNVATEAQAMNNARNAARTLGMNLTAQAAAQGTTNATNAINAGQGSAAASTGAFGVASGNVNTQNAGASVPLQGTAQGMQGSTAAGQLYAAPISSEASLGNQSLVASQASKQDALKAAGQMTAAAMGV